MWRAPELRRVTIVENRRLRTTLGRCRGADAIIELNRVVFELPERQFSEILCHEAAHLVARAKNGKTSPHGGEWARLVKRAGFAPRAKIPGVELLTAASARRRPTTPRLYVHRCPVCQFTRRLRTSANRWRCADCVANGLSGEMTVSPLGTDAGDK